MTLTQTHTNWVACHRQMVRGNPLSRETSTDWLMPRLHQFLWVSHYCCMCVLIGIFTVKNSKYCEVKWTFYRIYYHRTESINCQVASDQAEHQTVIMSSFGQTGFWPFALKALQSACFNLWTFSFFLFKGSLWIVKFTVSLMRQNPLRFKDLLSSC